MSDILHYYLDLLRGENEDRFGFHNVLNVMKQSRDGYVLNECFDRIDLRNEPLVGIHFSDEDGKNASSFCDCKVSRNCFLSGHSAPIESMEFIDDNTLVSRSANEVITWDIWSGVPIETEKNLNKSNYWENLKNLIKLKVSGNSGRYLTDEERSNNHIKINISKKRRQKEKYYPIYTLIEKRLLVIKSSNGHTLIYDLKTKKAFSCYANPDEILQVDSRLVFFDDERLWVYDYESEKDMPIPLDILLPQSERDYGGFSYSNTRVSLAHIENSDCIRVEISSSDKREDNYYIANINNMKTILKTKDHFFSVYIPEVDGIFVLYPDHAELINVLIEKPIIIFKKTYEYRTVFIDNLQLRNAVSKNKEYIAITNLDTSIQILSLKNGSLEKVLDGNTADYYSIVSSDRKYAVFCPDLYFKANHLLWNVNENVFIKYIENISLSSDSIFSRGSNYLFFHEDEAHYTELIDLNNNKSIRISMDYNNNHFKGTIAWDYTNNFLFWETGSNLFVYNNIGKKTVSLNWRELFNNQYHLTNAPKISDNNTYIVLSASPPTFIDDKLNIIAVINLQTLQNKKMNHNCLYKLQISEDGRYVTIVSGVDFDKAIIKTEVLDMHEQKVCSEETIENNYVLLNYLRQYVPEQQEIYTSDGWTIKVPSSPDNSTEALIYLVPNLYIGGCDFRGSTFDDETKEIIRQYNGIV